MAATQTLSRPSNGTPARTGTSQRQSLADYVQGRMGELQQIAASAMDIDRLYRLVVNCVSVTPKLQECSMESVFRAVSQCAMLGLEPNTPLGEAYMIPFGQECQFIIGYRGLVGLSRRSGMVASVEAFPVYEGDIFEVELGLDRKLRHIPGFGEPNPLKIKYVYAIARLKDGSVQFDVMTRQEILNIQARSKSGQNGPWKTDWAEMAKKTVIRRLSKLLPMSIETARAIEIDETNEFGELNATSAFNPAATPTPSMDDVKSEFKERCADFNYSGTNRALVVALLGPRDTIFKGDYMECLEMPDEAWQAAIDHLNTPQQEAQETIEEHTGDAPEMDVPANPTSAQTVRAMSR